MTQTAADRLATILARRADTTRGLVLHPERWCHECGQHLANEGGVGVLARLCVVCLDDRRLR